MTVGSVSKTAGPAILVEGLEKSFGSVRALRGVDLAVPRGTVLGVLGPNGAGKTTAVRIMTTLLKPDAGRVLIEGRDVVHDDAAVREVIGLAGQSAAIQDDLTGRENLEFVGRLSHLPKARYRARAAVPDRTRLADAARAVAGLTDEQPVTDPSTGQVGIRAGHRGSETLVQVVRNLDSAGIETRGLTLRRPSLDDVFLAITGHAAEEATESQPVASRRARPHRGAHQPTTPTGGD
jgi:ABC-type sugar transport system ATPase subunit